MGNRIFQERGALGVAPAANDLSRPDEAGLGVMVPEVAATSEACDRPVASISIASTHDFTHSRSLDHGHEFLHTGEQPGLRPMRCELSGDLK